MNDVAKQNFLKYSREERLDLKGNFYGERGARLKAKQELQLDVIFHQL